LQGPFAGRDIEGTLTWWGTRTTMMFPTFLGTIVLAASLGGPRAALLSVIDSDPNYAVCSRKERQAAAAGAELRVLGRIDGSEVVLAGVHAGCVCGSVNCPWLVLRLDPGRSRVLLSTYAFAMSPFDAEKPLPKLRAHAHDSALVADEAIEAFKDGRYLTIETARVRGDTGARKPNGIRVHFAYGASAAQLKGSASLGWYDEYVFGATKGQRLTIDGVKSEKKLSLTLFGPNYAQAVDLKPGVLVSLGQSGSFRLHVENGSDTDLPYLLTLSIR
jgi:hypothetical protein